MKMLSDDENATTNNNNNNNKNDDSKLPNHTVTDEACGGSTDCKEEEEEDQSPLGDEETRMFHWWDDLEQSNDDGPIFHDLQKKELLNILNWAHTNPQTKQTNADDDNNHPFQSKLDGISLLHLPTPTPPTNDQLRFLIQCAQQKKIPTNSLDFTAIMALGLALQESLTASLIPLAISHVNRCQSLNTTNTNPVMDEHNNRKRKYEQQTNNNNDDDDDDTKKQKRDVSSKLPNNCDTYDDTDPFHEWTLPYIEAIHKIIPATTHNQPTKSDDNIDCFRTSPSFLPSSIPATHQYDDDKNWKWSHVKDFYQHFSANIEKEKDSSNQSDKCSNTPTKEIQESVDSKISWTISDIKTLYKKSTTKEKINTLCKLSQKEHQTENISNKSPPPPPSPSSSSFPGIKETEVERARRWCKARGFHPDFVSNNCDLFSLFLNKCPK